MPEPSPSVLGTGRFELLRVIGSGGMGTVYEARDAKTGALVALKTLRAEGPSALLALKNEFRSLQDLRHENLAELLELVLEPGGRGFFTMELLDGVDFLSHVRPGASSRAISGVTSTSFIGGTESSAPSAGGTWDGPAGELGVLDEARLRDALVQLARGLEALHRAGVVHRDVKPSNILVNRNGRVVLLDFGLAAAARGSEASGAVGTRAFMAPEQAEGRPVGAAADCYGVGVMLFQALTGLLPFRGADADRQRAHGSLGIELPGSGAPADLVALCQVLLSVEPEARPSARDILARLGAESSSSESVPAPPFVGRAGEQRELLDALDESRSEAVVSVLIGDSGVGKTALASRTMDAARRIPGAVVLSGRCYERELVPYKAFDAIVDGLSHYLAGLSTAERARFIAPDAAGIVTVFPVLGRIAEIREPAEPVALADRDRRRAAFAALRSLLGRIADAHLLALWIDDLQWADPDSLELLDDLLAPPSPPKLFLLATIRAASEEYDAFAPLISRLGRVNRIALQPLTDSESRELGRSLLGTAASALLLDAVVRQGGGHPLLLSVLALGAVRKGSSLEGVEFDEALWSRIGSIDAGARHLLEMLAVAGAPLPESVARLASGTQAAEFGANARALCVLRLARRVSTPSAETELDSYHDRIREAVVRRIESSRRAAYHRALAGALEGTGHAEADPQALVRHLEGAGETIRAGEYAVMGAARAASLLAFDRAADLYAAALRLGGVPGDARAPMRLRLAEALANAGRGAEAARAYLECAEDHPETASEYRRVAADHFMRGGHLDDGFRVLRTVLADIGDEMPRSDIKALALTATERLRIRLHGDGYEQRDERLVPASELKRLDVYHGVSAALSLVDMVRGGLFQARSFMLARRVGEPRSVARSSIMEAVYSASSGPSGVPRARRLVEDAERIAHETGDPYLRAATHLARGFVTYLSGSFREAAGEYASGLEAFRSFTTGTHHEQSVCWTFRLVALRLSGALADLQDEFAGAVRDAERRGDRFTEAGLRCHLNIVWLAQDMPDEARRQIDRTALTRTDTQHWYTELARSELALYESTAGSHLPELRRFLRRAPLSPILRTRVHRLQARWLLGRLLVASVNAGKRDRKALVAASRLVTELDRAEEAYARVWARLLAAGVAHRRSEPERARRELEDAIDLGRTAGVRHCVAAAQFRLGQLTGDDTGRDLVEAALAALRAERVKNPPRLIEVWAPGF